MANKMYAIEWLRFAIKNLNTAKLLYKVKHYEDIIGIELQQTLEKSLKSLIAYNKGTSKNYIQPIEGKEGIRFYKKNLQDYP